MKKIFTIFLIFVFSIIFYGCGDDRKIVVPTVNGIHNEEKLFTQYGFANLNEKDSRVEYRLIIGNIVWGAILGETIIVPIIIGGWYLYEPVGPKE